jgi:hypothetical protein
MVMRRVPTKRRSPLLRWPAKTRPTKESAALSPIFVTLLAHRIKQLAVDILIHERASEWMFADAL